MNLIHNFCKPLKKTKSESCPSNQVSASARTSASDEKCRPFNCFFSRVGLRTYQDPCIHIDLSTQPTPSWNFTVLTLSLLYMPLGCVGGICHRNCRGVPLPLAAKVASVGEGTAGGYMTVADTVGMVVPPFAVAGEVAAPLLMWWQWLFCCAECKMTWSCRTPFSSLFLNLLRTIRTAIILTFVPTILSGFQHVYEVESNEVHNFKALVECSRNCIYNLMTEFHWTSMASLLNERLVCMLLWRTR